MPSAEGCPGYLKIRGWFVYNDRRGGVRGNAGNTGEYADTAPAHKEEVN